MSDIDDKPPPVSDKEKASPKKKKKTKKATTESGNDSENVDTATEAEHDHGAKKDSDKEKKPVKEKTEISIVSDKKEDKIEQKEDSEKKMESEEETPKLTWMQKRALQKEKKSMLSVKLPPKEEGKEDTPPEIDENETKNGEKQPKKDDEVPPKTDGEPFKADEKSHRKSEASLKQGTGYEEDKDNEKDGKGKKKKKKKKKKKEKFEKPKLISWKDKIKEEKNKDEKEEKENTNINEQSQKPKDENIEDNAQVNNDKEKKRDAEISIERESDKENTNINEQSQTLKDENIEDNAQVNNDKEKKKDAEISIERVNDKDVISEIVKEKTVTNDNNEPEDLIKEQTSDMSVLKHKKREVSINMEPQIDEIIPTHQKEVKQLSFHRETSEKMPEPTLPVAQSDPLREEPRRKSVTFANTVLEKPADSDTLMGSMISPKERSNVSQLSADMSALSENNEGKPKDKKKKKITNKILVEDEQLRTYLQDKDIQKQVKTFLMEKNKTDDDENYTMDETLDDMDMARIKLAAIKKRAKLRHAEEVAKVKERDEESGNNLSHASEDPHVLANILFQEQMLKEKDKQIDQMREALFKLKTGTLENHAIEGTGFDDIVTYAHRKMADENRTLKNQLASVTLAQTNVHHDMMQMGGTLDQTRKKLHELEEWYDRLYQHSGVTTLNHAPHNPYKSQMPLPQIPPLLSAPQPPPMSPLHDVYAPAQPDNMLIPTFEGPDKRFMQKALVDENRRLRAQLMKASNAQSRTQRDVQDMKKKFVAAQHRMNELENGYDQNNRVLPQYMPIHKQMPLQTPRRINAQPQPLMMMPSPRQAPDQLMMPMPQTQTQPSTPRKKKLGGIKRSKKITMDNLLEMNMSPRYDGPP